MENWIAWAFTTLLGAFTGSFLGAYMKKKAENLATHEDIDKLVKDLRALTTATKEIEARIAGDLWDRQKRWETKKEVLFESLRNVGKAQSIMTETIDALAKHDAAGTEEARSAAETRAIECVGRCKEGIVLLAESLTLVSSVTGMTVVDAFFAVSDSFGAVISAFHDASLRVERFKLFSRSVGLFQAAVRKELGIPAE